MPASSRKFPYSTAAGLRDTLIVRSNRYDIGFPTQAIRPRQTDSFGTHGDGARRSFFHRGSDDADGLQIRQP